MQGYADPGRVSIIIAHGQVPSCWGVCLEYSQLFAKQGLELVAGSVSCTNLLASTNNCQLPREGRKSYLKVMMSSDGYIL